MKFAFRSNAYTNFTLENSIIDIAKMGYQGIEIMCDYPHLFPLPLDENKISEIQNQLIINNLEVSNLNSFTLFGIGDTYHPSWIEENKDYRKLRVQHTINSLKLAHQLDAKNISVEPGGPINDRKNRDKYLTIFKEGINEVLPTAEEEKIKILIEPEPGLLLENSNDFIQFIKNFDSKFIGLNFDIGHFVCVNENPCDLIDELFDYIHHFHLADINNRIHNHLIPGLGSIDFKTILKVIDKKDFNGYITVELYPYKDNPTHAASQSFQYLKNILQI